MVRWEGKWGDWGIGGLGGVERVERNWVVLDVDVDRFGRDMRY